MKNICSSINCLEISTFKIESKSEAFSSFFDAFMNYSQKDRDKECDARHYFEHMFLETFRVLNFKNEKLDLLFSYMHNSEWINMEYLNPIKHFVVNQANLAYRFAREFWEHVDRSKKPIDTNDKQLLQAVFSCLVYALKAEELG